MKTRLFITIYTLQSVGIHPFLLLLTSTGFFQ